MSKPAVAPTAMTSAQRQARLRDARLAEGRVCLKSIWLTPEAAEKLALLVEKGETQTDVVNRLLARTRP